MEWACCSSRCLLVLDRTNNYRGGKQEASRDETDAEDEEGGTGESGEWRV